MIAVTARQAHKRPRPKKSSASAQDAYNKENLSNGVPRDGQARKRRLLEHQIMRKAEQHTGEVEMESSPDTNTPRPQSPSQEKMPTAADMEGVLLESPVQDHAETNMTAAGTDAVPSPNTRSFMLQLEQVLEDIRTKTSSLGLQCALADEEEAEQLQRESHRLESNRQVIMHLVKMSMRPAAPPVGSISVQDEQLNARIEELVKENNAVKEQLEKSKASELWHQHKVEECEEALVRASERDCSNTKLVGALDQRVNRLTQYCKNMTDLVKTFLADMPNPDHKYKPAEAQGFMLGVFAGMSALQNMVEQQEQILTEAIGK